MNKNDLKKIKCPSCGTNIDFNEDSIDTCYCEHCNSTIYLDGLSKESYKSKIKIKEMKHNEAMLDKKNVHEKEMLERKHEYKNKEKQQNLKIKILVASLIVLGLLLSILIPLFKSNRQEKELQYIVDEVMTLVEKKEYDKAYLKAKTIKYTANWSNEIGEKWEETRKTLIDYIIEQEKKENGKSNHKSEKSSIFDIFK